MRLVLALVRAVAVFCVFAALVLAGSSALREPHRRPAGAAAVDGTGGSGTTEGVESPAQDTPTRATSAPARALPPGGVPLMLTPTCESTSQRPGAGALQRGMLTLTSDDWQSADGGVSALLGDGRVVWMFGDTRKEVGSRSVGMVSSSMLISAGACFSQAVGKDYGPVLPRSGSATAPIDVWPTAVTALDRGTWSEVLVLGNRLERSRGFWGFTLLGATVTRFVVPDGGAPRRLSTVQVTADVRDAGHITWGTAAVPADGWLYVYGTRVVAGSLGREAYVARTRPDDLDDVSTWRFAGPGGWGAAARAAPVVSAAPGTSHIVSVFHQGGAWYLVSKAGGDLGDDVGVWKAAGPTGPFVLRARSRHPYEVTGHQVRYMPLAHPQYDAGGRTVVSMSRNITAGGGVAADHSLGRPEFFTITLP